MSQYTPRDDHELGAFSSSESAPEHKAPRTTYLREEPFDHDEDDGVFVAAPTKPMDIPADVDIVDDMHGSHHNSLSDAEDERKPWYSIFSRFFTWLVPYGGLFSNVLTLCSVTLGGGIIGMAHSFATSGIVMAIIYLVIVTTITIYTLTILGIVIRKIGVRNYEETGHVVFGRWGGYFVGFVLALSCTGTSISYISAAGSLVSPILLLAPGTPDYLKTRNGNRVIVVLIWVCLLVPVIIPKHVNSLRYVAFVAVFFVLYFVLCIVVHSCMNGLQEGVRDDMVLFSTGNRAIYSLSIYIFSFMNQGPIYSICLEMQPKLSIKQLTAAATIACVVCCVFYILAGVFGYLDFGSSVESSVLYNFDPVHEPYIMVAYIGMLIKICAAFSVNMIPLRNYLYYVLRWDLETTPYWRHSLLVVTFSGIVLVAGLFIPSISLAFGLVGSACGGFIGFIFPALFWMYSGNWTLKSVGIWNYIACHFLLVCGVIAIVWGTIATIYSSFFDDSM